MSGAGTDTGTAGVSVRVSVGGADGGTDVVSVRRQNRRMQIG